MIELAPDKRGEVGPALRRAFPHEPAVIDGIVDGDIGEVWVDDGASPGTIVAAGPTTAFLAGDPQAEAVAAIPARARYLMVDDPAWLPPVRARYRRVIRRGWTALQDTSVDPDRYDDFAAALPEGYRARLLTWADLEALHAAGRVPDPALYWRTAERYEARGFGVGVVHEPTGVIASSLHAVYAHGGWLKGYVKTHPDHQRAGLARGCTALFYRERAARSLAVMWGALTPAAVNLAVSLGYEVVGEYDTYMIRSRRGRG